MKTLYALRIKKVAKYPPEIKCPYQVGTYVGVRHSAYGSSLASVFNVRDVVFFTTRTEAEDVFNKYKDKHPIVLEIVEWRQT